MLCPLKLIHRWPRDSIPRPCGPIHANISLLNNGSAYANSTFSLPIRTHACGLLRVICQIWRRSPGWQWGGVFLPFVARPYLPSFTSHISFGHVQYRGQLWPLNSWECSLATLAAVKETHPCFSQFTPVLPVALLLWCCAPALLVSAGVLVWF